MPKVIVTSDQAEQGDVPVLLEEQVHSVHLSTAHSAMQFVERLGWAISDAEDAERVQVQGEHAGAAAPDANLLANAPQLATRPTHEVADGIESCPLSIPPPVGGSRWG